MSEPDRRRIRNSGRRQSFRKSESGVDVTLSTGVEQVPQVQLSHVHDEPGGEDEHHDEDERSRNRSRRVLAEVKSVQ